MYWRLDGLGEGSVQQMNRATLISPSGEILYHYDKVYSVPIVESFSTQPGIGPLPIAEIAIDPSPYSHGESVKFSVSTAICLDMDDPSLLAAVRAIEQGFAMF